MIAVDTNLVVHYLLGDDAGQAAKSRDVIDAQDVFVSKTVILETEWVLRDIYRVSLARVADALRAFISLPHVAVEDPTIVNLSLDWMTFGLDFADALHLASAEGCDAFLTFDKAFIKAAKLISGRTVRAP